MRAHLAAVRYRLTPFYSESMVDLFAATPGRGIDFIILEAPAWGADPDQSLCDSTAAFQADIRVKAVAGLPEGVATMLHRCRELLPGLLDVPGRWAHLQWVRSEFIDVDRDAIAPGTNRPPAFGVDTYLLTSQPV